MPPMSWRIVIVAAIVSANPALANPDEAAWWVSPSPLSVHSAPDISTPVLGRIAENEPFTVLDWVEAPGCEGQGWGLVEGGGHACLDGSTPSEEPPVRLPRLVAFVHPDPTEWETYLETMDYDRTPDAGVPALVPFIYAKRWRQWRAPTYASVAAYASGEPTMTRLGGLRKYHFIRAEQTQRGSVLVRSNGQAVPLEQVHVYPLSKFHGWDLAAEPVPEGALPAWAIAYEGTKVYAEPKDTAEVGRTLPYHTSLLVSAEPVDELGQWWELKDGLGPDQPGYVNHNSGIRHWVPAAPPADIGADELWIDVDLDQQVLALRRGAVTEFVTLVSSGVAGWGTPRGLYHIRDKTVYGDMQSRPDAEEPYHVEKVPWVIHFWPRYAIHGVFWHWGFGHQASHGCINMSVRDARLVFDRIDPAAHDGWMTAYASGARPGTTLRVRRGDAPVRDRRP
jgi:hypothetical protein